MDSIDIDDGLMDIEVVGCLVDIRLWQWISTRYDWQNKNNCAKVKEKIKGLTKCKTSQHIQQFPLAFFNVSCLHYVVRRKLARQQQLP